MAKKIGRPTRYTKALAEEICAQLATGKSLRAVCRQRGMPHKDTVLRWLTLDSMEDFRSQYARAREHGIEEKIDELAEVAKDTEKLVLKHQDNPKIAAALVQAQKIKSDNIKWAASKLKPKKYGDKLDVTSGDKPLEQPLQIFNMRPVDLRKAGKKKPEKGKK